MYSVYVRGLGEVWFGTSTLALARVFNIEMKMTAVSEAGCHFWTNIIFVHQDCGKRRKGRPFHELDETQKLIYSQAHGRPEQR